MLKFRSFGSSFLYISNIEVALSQLNIVNRNTPCTMPRINNAILCLVYSQKSPNLNVNKHYACITEGMATHHSHQLIELVTII